MADNCYIVYKGKNYTQEDFLDYLKLNKCVINALVLIIINFNLSFFYKDTTKVIKRRLRNYDTSIIKY